MNNKVSADAKKADIDIIFKKLNQPAKPFNVRDFVGKIRFGTDPLELQRDLR